MQITEKTTELQADLARASGEHFRLVWIAGGTAAERSALLRALSDAENGRLIDVGKVLSTALIDVPLPLRTASVEDCFVACLGAPPAAVSCLNHLEILFDPSLRTNPVALVRGASRYAVIVAAWPGNVIANRLSFGSSDHPAYMELSEQDIGGIVHFI